MRIIIVFMAFTCVAIMGPTPANAEDFVWQNFTYNDEANRGRYTARLTYQVPETDNVQLQAFCVAGSSGTEIQVTIGYDVTGRSDGAKVVLKIQTDTYKATHSVEIYGTQLEFGVSGALLYVEPSNPFWHALASGRTTMTYSVAGGTKASMKLKGSAKPVRTFVEDCRKIQESQ